MALNHSVVQVRVGDGILWVGGEAYPLRNISHVGQRILEVNKGAAWKRFVIRSLIWLVVGGILAQLLDIVGVLLLIAVQALLVWQLVSVLSRPAVYGLVVNTSGTQRDAVWSTARSEIGYLVSEVAKAIGRPDSAQLVFNVAHAVQGDLIQQYGAGSIGKQHHSGFGDNVVGG
ncbi:DUF6232 family protein [Nonomuraea sp. LPB2021202275-12-8]|uniref:DUF6232 family protein n=1 Tax=Nonomuraea sp. LPB2021202275-12-8 TaxID=3120159 RepID=UPI00300CD994